MSTNRDTPAIAVDHATSATPLDARSLALSALLGTHPPQLTGRRLVALAELFGIASGTMRTALSRMVAAGELDLDDGRYRLTGRLLGRQAAQDIGRAAPPPRWDGTWHTAVALDVRRPLDARRRARAALTEHRFGELRPDVWMRPANLRAPELDGWAITTGELAGAAGTALAGQLWNLAEIAAAASALDDGIRALAAPDADRPATIPPAFHHAAAIVRFLRAEPLLPAALLPSPWPVDALRSAYDALERDLQAALDRFFRVTAAR